MDGVIDVTIVYPGGTPSVWHYVSGQVRKISVHIKLRPIDTELRGGNFREDPAAKSHLKTWLNGMWEEKERRIAETLSRELEAKPR